MDLGYFLIGLVSYIKGINQYGYQRLVFQKIVYYLYGTIAIK